ncbi:MAG TPA: adenylate/guanylate cyclase domain-containing protein [Chitinophagaceae bacterium]
MKSVFQNKFEHELLISERRRIIILIIIFVAAIALRLINRLLFQADEDIVRIESFSTVWLFPLTILVFESLSLFYINGRIKTKRNKHPLPLQFINAGFEICLPSLIIFYVAKEYPFYNVLQSPAVFVYFIFIILSTLRLNFSLSVFCGALASLSYAVFSIFLYDRFKTNDAAPAIILFMSGVAAGLVAKQIKQGINNSLQEAEKRHRVENLFGQQISAAVAEKMLENNGRFESKRMQVAVMFIDIRNFTHFATGKSPEEVVQYQNMFLSIVIDTVTKHDGIVNQILGDGCMVTFGAPIPLHNPSQKAVNAAIDVLAQLETAIQKGMIRPTRIGIGIHTGEAVTGNIGTATRQQYSITGSVVIMASRIEQLNKEFHSQILISEDVYDSIGSIDAPIELYKDIPLKGFEKNVSLYKVA